MAGKGKMVVVARDPRCVRHKAGREYGVEGVQNARPCQVFSQEVGRSGREGTNCKYKVGEGSGGKAGQNKSTKVPVLSLKCLYVQGNGNKQPIPPRIKNKHK